VGGLPAGPEPPADLDAVEPRHQDVQHQDRRLERADLDQRIVAIGRARQREATGVVGQGLEEHGHRARVVVRDQDPLTGALVGRLGVGGRPSAERNRWNSSRKMRRCPPGVRKAARLPASIQRFRVGRETRQ
jgi:hypothetical protein